MTQRRMLSDESDSREGGLTCANHRGSRPYPKRRISHIPNESSSSWFKTAPTAEGDEETESGPETEGPGARNTDLDQALHSSPSKRDQTNLEMDHSESEIQSDEDSEKSYNHLNPPAVGARKIYLAPDRYSEHIFKAEREAGLKQHNQDGKRRKPWERRSMLERGPRAGRSDEFHTEEEAQYAESIMRAAARHRLETWHRERHEMWGLNGIEVPFTTPKEMEGLAEEGGEGGPADKDMQLKKKVSIRSGASNSRRKTSLKAAPIPREDMGDSATIEEILQAIPNPFDPCFYTPADSIFLPRTPKFTEVVFRLEYQLGYTRKQVRWLMGGERAGRGAVPSANTIGMRLQRYMKKNNLMDTVKAAPAGAVQGPKTPLSSERRTANSGNINRKGSISGAEQEPHLLPHGPRIRRPELGVHGWVWDHPHEIQQKLGDSH